MGLQPIDLTTLVSDFMAWSGGFAPDEHPDEDLIEYTKANVPDTQAKEALKILRNYISPN